MTIPAACLAALTPDQRAQLAADPVLAEAFEASAQVWLPKPQGVCWSGMSSSDPLPVHTIFANALIAVRGVRQASRVAA